MRLNGVFPDFPVVPDCRRREKRDIVAFKRGVAHLVSLPAKPTSSDNTAIGKWFKLQPLGFQERSCLLLLSPLRAGFFLLCWHLVNNDLCPRISWVKPPVGVAFFHLTIVLIYKPLHKVKDQTLV